MELARLTDEQLEEHRVSLLAELDRRNKLRDIPADVKRLARDFDDLGGNNADLVTAVRDIELPAGVGSPTIE